MAFYCQNRANTVLLYKMMGRRRTYIGLVRSRDIVTWCLIAVLSMGMALPVFANCACCLDDIQQDADAERLAEHEATEAAKPGDHCHSATDAGAESHRPEHTRRAHIDFPPDSCQCPEMDGDLDDGTRGINSSVTPTKSFQIFSAVRTSSITRLAAHSAIKNRMDERFPIHQRVHLYNCVQLT